MADQPLSQLCFFGALSAGILVYLMGNVFIILRRCITEREKIDFRWTTIKVVILLVVICWIGSELGKRFDAIKAKNSANVVDSENAVAIDNTSPSDGSKEKE